MSTTALHDLSERALARVASYVAGAPVSVLLTSRITHPAVVVLQSRSLYLDPERVDAYDLILLADLMARRAEVRGHALSDTEVDLSTVATWIEAAKARIGARFPGVRRLPGRYRGALDVGDLPQVTWRRVQLDELDLDALGGAPGGLIQVSGDDLLGIDGDVEAIRRLLAEGRIPVHELACLREMPYAELPVTLHLATGAAPPAEVLDERRRDAREMAAGILSCYVDNVRGIGDSREVVRRSTGARLDPTRLFEVGLPHTPGHVPRVFRLPPRERFTTFKPDQHLAVVAIDVSSFHPHMARRGRLNVNLVRAMAMTFESLDMDFVVVAFRDRVVDLGDGRKVYLHLPLVLKRADEPLTDAIWGRIDTLWFDMSVPDDHATFSPLHLRTAAALFDEAAIDRDYRFYKLVYLSIDRLGEGHEHPDHPERAGQDIESTLKDLQDRFDGTWSLECFFDRSIVSAARPGSLLAEQSAIGS